MNSEVKQVFNYSYTESNFNLLKDKLRSECLKNQGIVDELEKTKCKLKWLEEQIKLANLRTFGKKTEVSPKQGVLPIFDEFEADEVEQTEEKETITYVRRKKKSCGRKLDTTKLPREQILHDLAEKEKICSCCGESLEQFGEDRSEQLTYKPAELKVIEHITPKYKCKKCNDIKQQKKPEVSLAKSMADVSLLTEIIISKYEYHLPLYRRSKMFAREGIEIPDNTLGNWVMGAGELLLPLMKTLYSQLDKIKVLQADETPVKVLDIDKKGYMWCYHSCEPKNRFMIFEYNESRGSKVVTNRLTNYKGILQTDGYAGYNELRAKKEIIGVGCWAHCRRKFVDIIKISSKAGKAHSIVNYIDKLYRIENTARKNNLNFQERYNLRQEKAKLLLQKLKKLLDKSLLQAPPQSTLGKALSYAIKQWPYLYKYVNHGEVEIDNNLVENQIRPFALGRRNWLFNGNEHGATISALYYSLIQTCAINGINARRYLQYVLTQAHKMRRKEINPILLLPQFIDRKSLE